MPQNREIRRANLPGGRRLMDRLRQFYPCGSRPGKDADEPDETTPPRWPACRAFASKALRRPDRSTRHHSRAARVGRIGGGTGRVGKLALPSRSTAWTAKNRSSLERCSTTASARSAGLFAASSDHRGGANFAFCDGSVHFLKDTISSWQLDTSGGANTGDPLGVTYNSTSQTYTLAPGTQFGVYQALSTRNGGEVISSDQF